MNLRRTSQFRSGLFALTISLIGIASPVWAETNLSASPYVGHYYLSGVREVGAELQLNPDGRFTYQMAYGAVDQSASGRWSLTGSRITLTTDPQDPPSLKLGRTSDKIEGPYSEPSERPVSLVVEVISPSLGMVWSNMEVTAEFSNQMQRSGRTGDNGMLGFDKRNDDVWNGAVIKRIRVEYPKVKLDTGWMDIDADKVRTLTFFFEPGNLIPLPFKELQLQAVRSKSKAISLVGVTQDGEAAPEIEFNK